MSEPRRITERYRLEKRVSSKESGTVFRAVDTLLGSTVAVKLINAESVEAQRDAFLDQAAALQGLEHPALPRLLDYGLTTAGSAFLVTEYLPGTSFEEFADAPPVRVLSLLLLLAEGLEALGESGIAHGNLRPENLMVVSGPSGEQVKILGLGSAVFSSHGAGIDGHRTDLRDFSLIALRSLGIDPAGGPVELPLEVAASLEEPEALRVLLESALHGDPEGRFPSYREVRKALRTALFGETGRRPARTAAVAPAPEPPPGATAPLSLKGGWEEVHIGSGAGPVDPAEIPNATAVVQRLGPAPAPPPSSNDGTLLLHSTAAPPVSAPPPARPTAAPENETRILRQEDLAPPPPEPPPPPPAAEPPPGMWGTLRVVPPLPDPPPSDGTVRLSTQPQEAPPAEPARASTTGTVRFPRTTASPAPVPEPLPEEPLLEEPPPPRRGATIPFPVPAPRPVPQEEPAVEGKAAFPGIGGAATQPVQLPPTPLPPPPAARPAAPQRAGQGSRLLLWIGIPAAVLLLAGVAVGVWLWQRAPEPPPKPAAAKPAPPKPRPTPPPVATPPPVNAQIVLAESLLGAGDMAGARTALEAIPPEQAALFTAEEQDRYNRVLDAFLPLQSEQWGKNLAQGLASSNLRLLRAVVASPPDAASLTPEQKKDLARARKIVDLDAKLAKAQRSKSHGEVLRLATALLADLPDNARADQLREEAAAALEADAGAQEEQARFGEALERLEQIRRQWPDRPGLEEGIARLRAEQRSDADMEEALAAATRAERSNRPQEGLRVLSGTKPNARYAARFSEARERLEAQFAQLDRNPPQVTLAGASEQTYEKGEVITVPLRIVDDYEVKSVEAQARPEGGRYTRVEVRHLSGSDYEAQIPPALHQNKNVDLYVTAADNSGHAGQLGSAQGPIKIKRKKWYSKILGDKEDGR